MIFGMRRYSDHFFGFCASKQLHFRFLLSIGALETNNFRNINMAIKLKNLSTFNEPLENPKVLVKFKNNSGYLKISTPSETFIYKGNDFSGIFRIYAKITSEILEFDVNVNKIVKRLKKAQDSQKY
eukprot:NODE_16_length_41655_cov_0.272813.p24 type:complete len:126 gc:universal NODE_16_length_41655_cov_0.272813:25504-25881(+)